MHVSPSFDLGNVVTTARAELDWRHAFSDVIVNTGAPVTTVDGKVGPDLQYRFLVLLYRHADGRKYENGVITREVVEFAPNRFSLTVDPQLKTAVASLMRRIGADSDCRDEQLIEQCAEVKATLVKKK